MQFTKEIEENGKIPYLDCLVTRDNNKLKTTLLDGTLTVTLIPTLTPTLALLRQRLYRTSEAPLKLLHVY